MSSRVSNGIVAFWIALGVIIGVGVPLYVLWVFGP